MDKKIIPVLALLFALMLLWPVVDRKWIKPMFPAKAVPQTAVISDQEPPAPSQESIVEQTPVQSETSGSPAPKAEPSTQTAIPVSVSVPDNRHPEQFYEITSPLITLTFSSYGAGIHKAVLSQYPELNQPGSGPVELFFTNTPALLYQGLIGIAPTAEFTLLQQTPTSLLFQVQAADGLSLTRSIALENNYELSVVDSFVNQSRQIITNSDLSIQLGGMKKSSAHTMKGLVDLGMDVFSPGIAIPDHYGNTLDRLFTTYKTADGRIPVSVETNYPGLLDWVAVKNKYFVQIVSPDNGGDGCTLTAVRQLAPQEIIDPLSIVKMQPVSMVSATIQLPDLVLKEQETVTRMYRCYIGPKEYKILKTIGFNQEGVMEFASPSRIFRPFNFIMVPVKVSLLWLLNFIHDHVWPYNYGIAIILITILIRIIFWPVTHKSTESMKKMQALQPLVKALKEKYKNDQQKLQQATMALYKEHKVNPMGGCLPMLIQIPVFIALFVVLRNAIELRFAHFLWVTDLSEPENLLANILPIPLNILPLIMVVTQFIQQKMTPTSADPQQAKIMQYMPVMFLFFFYTMPSGLVLYWTTNQCLMIIQQLFTRRKQQAQA